MNPYEKLRPWTVIEACTWAEVTALVCFDCLTDNPIRCAVCKNEVDPERRGLFSELDEPVNVEQKADELAPYLEHGDDPRRRLRCVLLPGPVPAPSVDRAFLRAWNDPDETIVQRASREVAECSGAEGTAAVFRWLEHPSWHVR